VLFNCDRQLVSVAGGVSGRLKKSCAIHISGGYVRVWFAFQKVKQKYRVLKNIETRILLLLKRKK